MKTFKGYLTEFAVQSTSDYVFDTPSGEAGSLKIPISGPMFKRIWPDTIRATVFHVTDNLEKLGKLEGKKKSISAFFSMMSRYMERGIATGGGIVAEMDADVLISASSDIMSQTTRDKSFKDRLPSGNYLENTANHYVVVLGESPQTALISMKATQLKISRKWNSIMMGLKLNGKNGLFTPPTYSHIYNLKTVQMSNDKGTWFGWEVSKVGPVQDQGVYQVAKSFADKVGKGAVEVKHGSDESKSNTPY